MDMDLKTRKRLAKWIDVTAVLEIEGEKIQGALKYGVVLPGSEAGFVECSANSKDKLYGEEPDYWFIGNKAKVKLLRITQYNGQKVIFGLGQLGTRMSTFTLRKRRGRSESKVVLQGS